MVLFSNKLKTISNVKMSLVKDFVPINVLTKQICWQCNLYLSVGPVMISPNNRIICGRCADINVNNTLCNSMYNNVAKDLMFNCINHYEGCLELLSFNEVIEHEKTCIGIKHTCFFCSYEGIVIQLMEHFKRKHSSSLVTEDGIFKIKLIPGYQKVFIYTSPVYNFVVKVNVDNEFIFVSTSAIPLNSEMRNHNIRLFRSDKNNIEFNLIMCSSKINTPIFCDGTNLYKCCLNDIKNCYSNTEWVYCILNLNDIESHYNHYKTTVVEHLTDIKNHKKEIENLKLKNNELQRENTKIVSLKQKLNEIFKIITTLICSNCHLNNIHTVLYFCCNNSSTHILCENCYSKSPEICIYCRNHSVLQRLDMVTQNIDLPCYWDNCKEQILMSDYTHHKRNCEYRYYKCPVDGCEWGGKLENLKKHWHMENVALVNMEDLEIVARKKYRLKYFVIAFKEIFKFEINCHHDVDIHQMLCMVNFNEICVVEKGNYKCIFNQSVVSKDSTRVVLYNSSQYSLKIEMLFDHSLGLL